MLFSQDTWSLMVEIVWNIQILTLFLFLSVTRLLRLGSIRGWDFMISGGTEAERECAGAEDTDKGCEAAEYA